MLTSKNLYFLYLWILYEIPSSLADTIMIDFADSWTVDPPQTKCLLRKAFLNDNYFLSMMPREWDVTRATLRTTLPATIKEPSINCCSERNWWQSCPGRGGIKILRDWDRNKNGGPVKITKAYSKKFNNIVVFTESIELADPHYIILGGAGKRMQIYTEDQKEQEIPFDKIPILALYAQARTYALTMYGYRLSNPTDEILWAMYQNCDEDMAWIEVSSSVIKSNGLDAVNASIDKALQHKTFPTMEAVPLGLPFATGS